jgi:predicted RNase H-like nuclease
VTVAGVDGVPGGWVVARLRPGGGDPDRGVDWNVLPDAAAVLAWTAGCDAVGVDIPIGVPASGRRRCDQLAAARLGPARASVFPAPPRAVLNASDYRHACALARAATGKAISQQTWRIVPKIAEWATIELPASVVETHPELSFRALAPGRAFAPKRTARGAGQRIAALARWLDLPAAVAELPAGARLDDVLDALACAWSAARWAAGRAEPLGGEPDDRGRPMLIAV